VVSWGAVFFHVNVLLSLFIMLWKNKALEDSFILEVWGLPSVKTLRIETPLLALRRSFVTFAEFLGTDVGFVRRHVSRNLNRRLDFVHVV
jgi:hypothetical protein